MMDTHLVYTPASQVKVGDYVNLPERLGGEAHHRVYDVSFYPYSKTVALFLEGHKTGCKFFAADEHVAIGRMS